MIFRTSPSGRYPGFSAAITCIDPEIIDSSPTSTSVRAVCMCVCVCWRVGYWASVGSSSVVCLVRVFQSVSLHDYIGSRMDWSHDIDFQYFSIIVPIMLQLFSFRAQTLSTLVYIISTLPL